MFLSSRYRKDDEPVTKISLLCSAQCFPLLTSLSFCTQISITVPVIGVSWGKGEEGGGDKALSIFASYVWSFKTRSQAMTEMMIRNWIN